MKQSTYLCVILHVKHKKLPILSVFNYEISISGKNSRWRQFLGTPQASSRWAIFYGCRACWEDERLFNTTAKSFRNTAIYQKFKGEVPSTPTPNPPPPPPCKTVRVWGMTGLPLLPRLVRWKRLMENLRFKDEDNYQDKISLKFFSRIFRK